MGKSRRKMSFNLEKKNPKQRWPVVFGKFSMEVLTNLLVIEDMLVEFVLYYCAAVQP